MPHKKLTYCNHSMVLLHFIVPVITALFTGDSSITNNKLNICKHVAIMCTVGTKQLQKFVYQHLVSF